MTYGKVKWRPFKGRVYTFPALLTALVIFLLLVFLKVNCSSSYQKAQADYEAARYDSAIVSFNQLIVEFPAKKEAYYNRGLCYYHMNKPVEAAHDFDTCIQIDPVFQDAIFMKCLVLQKQGDWKSSFNEFKLLNTSYSGYNEVKKRIQYYHASVYICRNWYYMIAIMFMFIILVGVLAKTYAIRKGY